MSWKVIKDAIIPGGSVMKDSLTKQNGSVNNNWKSLGFLTLSDPTDSMLFPDARTTRKRKAINRHEREVLAFVHTSTSRLMCIPLETLWKIVAEKQEDHIYTLYGTFRLTPETQKQIFQRMEQKRMMADYEMA